MNISGCFYRGVSSQHVSTWDVDGMRKDIFVTFRRARISRWMTYRIRLRTISCSVMNLQWNMRVWYTCRADTSITLHAHCSRPFSLWQILRKHVVWNRCVFVYGSIIRICEWDFRTSRFAENVTGSVADVCIFMWHTKICNPRGRNCSAFAWVTCSLRRWFSYTWDTSRACLFWLRFE